MDMNNNSIHGSMLVALSATKLLLTGDITNDCSTPPDVENIFIKT
jgi:hypothetical protein